MTIHTFQVQFDGLVFNSNQWISVFATWDANSGLAQMFVNKVASIKKAVGPKESFKGNPVIALGQYQTQYDGGFNEHNTFTGFIADVHVHGQVLTTHQIKTYMEAKTKYKLGDYINWHNLMYTVENSVLLKCRKLRREDQETSDSIVSRISLFYDMCCYLQSSKISS